MKKSFTNFFRKNLAAARLAVLSQVEYRINFLIDVMVQPAISTLIEVTLWMAILTGMRMQTLGGFGRESYLAYALWATTVGRITTNWMYEFIMLDEIDTGRVNSILTRPISFYEFYLSQFLGYKIVVAGFSLLIPIVACYVLHAPIYIWRLPATLALMAFYLILVYTISFCVSCFAFFLNRAHSFVAMKNLALWVLSGELVPLDLYPEPLRTWMLHSPFASGVYIPVGYMVGRVDTPLFTRSFLSVALGLLFFSCVATVLWGRGVRAYTGTGA